MSDHYYDENESQEMPEIETVDPDFFVKTYGFEHNCRCAEDYMEGNVGTVSACWAQMADDALEQCKRFKAEIELLKLRNADLTIQIKELGGTPRTMEVQIG